MSEPERKRYDVLDPGAVFCGGQRVDADRTVALTEEQARYPLQAGEIEPAKARAAARRSRADGEA